MSDDNICAGCGRKNDFVPALAVIRRRYDVCGDCMDVLEHVLENQLLGDSNEAIDR